jgi:pentatricopeptide repeat protein
VEKANIIVPFLAQSNSKTPGGRAPGHLRGFAVGAMVVGKSSFWLRATVPPTSFASINMHHLSDTAIANLAHRVSSTPKQRLHTVIKSGELTPRCYALLLTELRTRNDWVASKRTIEWATSTERTKINVRHWTTAISTCASAKRWREALRLLALASDQGHLDLSCFNAVIAACASAGRVREAMRLLERDIPAAGLRADAYSYAATFNAIGQAACRGGHMQRRQYAEEARQLKPNPRPSDQTIATPLPPSLSLWFDPGSTGAFPLPPHGAA